MSRGRERESEKYTSDASKDQGDGDDKVPSVDLSIAQVFMQARQKRGLTQKELSERTGIAQGNISKLERGNANPSLRTMLRLARGMRMTLKIDFCEEMEEPEDTNENE
ncbi:MAG: helix-turn-helix transcriptional regulator [Blautia sp.]|nr:helix-turn-helix transcriptional regulator [Blautia sp.]